MHYKNKKNKFKAAYIGNFASKLENSVHNLLLLRERSGEIKDIKCQDCVKMTKAMISWKVDFSFTDILTDKRIYCEAKGFETPDYLLKLKLWKFYGHGDLEIWKGTYKKPNLYKIIKVLSN